MKKAVSPHPPIPPSPPLVKIVYQRQAFDNQAVPMVSEVLVAYSLGMFPSVGRQILTRVCYALNDAKTHFSQKNIPEVFYFKDCPSLQNIHSPIRGSKWRTN